MSNTGGFGSVYEELEYGMLAVHQTKPYTRHAAFYKQVVRMGKSPKEERCAQSLHCTAQALECVPRVWKKQLAN